MARRSGSESPPTPRTSFEIWDFGELDAAEELRSAVAGELPLKCLREVEVGARVQVLNDAAALLRACRTASIGTEHDKMRIAFLGSTASVLEKDPKDNTVLCSLPAVGEVWLPLPVLSRVSSPARPAGEEPGPAPRNPSSAAAAAPMGVPSAEEARAASGARHLEGPSVGGQRSTEDLVQRRLFRPGFDDRECVLGLLMIVEESAGRARVKRLFRDAVNEDLAKLRKMLTDNAAPACAGGLLERLTAIVAFLGGLLQFHIAVEGPKKPQASFNFISAFIANGAPDVAASKVSASTHCETFVALLRGKRGVCRGLAAILRGGRAGGKLLGPAPEQGKALDEACRQMLACLAGLMGWVRWPRQEDRARAEAAFATMSGVALRQQGGRHALGAAGSDLYEVIDNCTWLEWVVQHRDMAELMTITRTSPVTATQLLYELRAGFHDAQFQDRYLSLQNRVDLSCSDVHQQSSALAFAVQAAVLPRYGFEASASGVTEMHEEMQHYAACVKDEAVAKLTKDIEQLLNLRKHHQERLNHVKQRRGRRRFHTVGDSHCAHGWPSNVCTHYVGSTLCYNIGRISLQGLEPPIQAGDAVCFCFGEIDCRCHVRKHVEGDRTHQDVIDEIISRYFTYLREQVVALEWDIHIFVYNVLPPVRAHIMYHRDGVMAYPWAGTDEERLSYVRYFNQRLQAECAAAGYTFFDVHDRYATEDGFLNMELSDGGVHVQESRPLKDFIDQAFR